MTMNDIFTSSLNRISTASLVDFALLGRTQRRLNAAGGSLRRWTDSVSGCRTPRLTICHLIISTIRPCHHKILVRNSGKRDDICSAAPHIYQLISIILHFEVEIHEHPQTKAAFNRRDTWEL